MDPTAMDPTAMDPTAMDPTALDPTVLEGRTGTRGRLIEGPSAFRFMVADTLGRTTAIRAPDTDTRARAACANTCGEPWFWT